MADSAPIKPEPTDATPPLDEEDLYEDAGDLDFYDPDAPANERLYLARVPKYMWKAWMKLASRLGDDDEIQIGTLRTWKEPAPGANPEEPGHHTVDRLRMLLQAATPEHQSLPREYDVEILSSGVANTFVFSEEDLPGFRARNKARAAAANAGIPTSLLRNKGPETEKPRYDRRSRYQPYYRKAIPKKTKVFGKICYDVRVEPRDREEEEALLAQQLLDAEQGKTRLQIISRNKASNIVNPGVGASASWGGNFIKNAPSVVKPKKGETIKATRIPKDQLLDLIFECFREFQYWPMKALRQKTRQPDSYLRQVLEEVAILIKSGRFANNYTLSDAYRDMGGNQAKDAAAEAEADDDDDEEMEDVPPA